MTSCEMHNFDEGRVVMLRCCWPQQEGVCLSKRQTGALG